MRQIHVIVKVVFGSTFDLINPNNRQHSFELFGLDFMIDQSGRVYFLEANSGPSLSESNAYLSSLLHRMMGRVVSN